MSVARPSLALFGSEPWRAAVELARHSFSGSRPAEVGDGHPVLLFPGLGSDGLALVPLRKHCNSLGYRAFDWRLGRNTGPRGDINAWMDVLKTHIESLLAPYDQPATLIGWSLGGLYARELAKVMTSRIRQVITLGTPFNATVDQTHAGWALRLLSGSSGEIDPELRARLRVPPPVPTTSIYSRGDGVVAWQTCRHEKHDNPQVEDIEVEGSHLGMGWNPEVMRLVAERLAR